MGLSRRKARDNAGFTILETLIAMGIAAVLSLGIADMMVNQNRAMKGAENRSDYTVLQNTLSQVMNNPNACPALFNGIKLPLPGGGTLSALAQPVNFNMAGTPPVFGHLQINRIQLTNVQSPGANTYTANLVLNVSAIGATFGAPLQPITIPMVATVNGGNDVTGCSTSSLGGGTANYVPLWTSPGSLGNSIMYQTGGNIGVGTMTPQATLDVNGTVRLGGVSVGAKCATEGLQAYDYGKHYPVYCNNSLKWTGSGTTIGQAIYASDNGAGADYRGSEHWLVGNDGSGFGSSSTKVVTNIGANRNCLAALNSWGEGNDSDQFIAGCRYDPASGNVYATTHVDVVACMWICTN